MQHERSDGKDQHTADRSGDHSQLENLACVAACQFQIALSHDVAKQDSSCARRTEAQNGTEVAHYDDQGVRCHGIGSQVTQNHGVHGESHTPGDIIEQSRKRQMDEIFYQQLVAQEHVSRVEPDIMAAQRHDDTTGQFDDAGKSSCHGNTGGSELRCPKQAENKDGI